MHEKLIKYFSYCTPQSAITSTYSYKNSYHVKYTFFFNETRLARQAQSFLTFLLFEPVLI